VSALPFMKSGTARGSSWEIGIVTWAHLGRTNLLSHCLLITLRQRALRRLSAIPAGLTRFHRALVSVMFPLLLGAGLAPDAAENPYVADVRWLVIRAPVRYLDQARVDEIQASEEP
jgi:hypothetical protein